MFKRDGCSAEIVADAVGSDPVAVGFTHGWLRFLLVGNLLAVADSCM